MSAEKVEKAAMELTQKQRAKLASLLLRSLHPEPADPKAAAEDLRETLIRRAREVDEGKVVPLSGEEAGAIIQEVLTRRRRP